MEKPNITRGTALSRDTDLSAALPVRILLVDGHSILRQSLKHILAATFPNSVFGEAVAADEAVALLEQHPWNVVLLNIATTGDSGLTLLKRLVTVRPNMAVLILSGKTENECPIRAFNAGAAGYLAKTTTVEEVIAAVKTVLAGVKYLGASFAKNLAEKPGGQLVPLKHELLSTREFQVMRLIVLGKRGKEIASDLCLSDKTVSTYRTRLMQKMNFKTNAELILYAIREHLFD